MKRKLTANTIDGNEKAWELRETHRQSPGNRGVRRYQIIQVIRNGQIVEYSRDMGLAKTFKGVQQLRIPSLLEHSVDELRDMANYLREKVNIDVKDLLGLENYKPA